ncbi:SH3 domain-containing protein [Kribbella sp.]|uniref:SH3 domain-containing protein n=1 Tax=Kribbella sp. TaxID=1871183 RepID=UPI002D2D70A5|nr:SH3 domain-containing protein [Kribbella sp.]HZX07429.1 SH3 domain-containing protein [Kribbella sp.]
MAGRHSQARHRQLRPKVLQPGIVKVAIPGAAVALVATGSAAAFPSQHVQLEPSIASSSLQLSRDTTISRDALRPPINPTTATPSSTPKPTPTASPTAKHLKKQAPIPKPTAAKTRASQEVTQAPQITGTKYTTTDVNLWSLPLTGILLDVLPKGTKISVTGKVDGLYAEVVSDGKSRWVKSQYLAATKPVAQVVGSAGGAISQAACKSGSGMEQGLTPDAIRVHRAICAMYPDISTYGGLRAGDTGSEHATGHAVDIMINSASEGQAIADWLKANYKKLGVSQLIWEQHIWTVQRSSEGWRAMPDRGSATANHMDHVHVSVYGNSGTV